MDFEDAPVSEYLQALARKNVSAEGSLVCRLGCLLPGGMSCGPYETESEGVFELCRTLRCFINEQVFAF